MNKKSLDHINLIVVLELISAYKLFFLLAILCSLGTAYIYLKIKVPEFSAFTVIEIKSNSDDFSPFVENSGINLLLPSLNREDGKIIPMIISNEFLGAFVEENNIKEKIEFC